MLNPPQIHRRLSDGAAAAVRGDRVALDETASWLRSVTTRELLRIDDYARRLRYEGPALGKSQEWTREVLASPLPVVLVLASMHQDGHVRERAVLSLVTSLDAVSDRALALRAGDHVEVIRERAVREVLRRTTLDHADHMVPLLHRLEARGRGAEVLALYLRALVTEHGEADVWARLRNSADRVSGASPSGTVSSPACWECRTRLRCCRTRGIKLFVAGSSRSSPARRLPMSSPVCCFPVVPPRVALWAW